MTKRLLIFSVICLMFTACVSSQKQANTRKIAEATRTQGEALLAQRNYTGALAKLLEAEKLTPADPYLHNSLGLAYMGKKRDDLAEAAFERALDLKPDFTEALNNLGAAYIRQEKWDLAIEKFEKVTEDLLYPTPHFPLSNMGWAYLGKKDYLRAETQFLNALDALPWFVTASHGLSRVYLETGQVDRAIAYLSNCLNRHPDAAILHADLAEAYESKGAVKQAARAWQQVFRFAVPNSSLSREAEERISRLN